MLNLSAKNIRLNGSAANKEEAIKQVAAGLVANNHVAEGYADGMFAREQQTSTFLGNGIAIPHGTLDTRHLVQETGVQIIQFPQGVQWGDGNTAYVVIGIAAKSDEHLTLLRQLTTVLSDEDAAAELAKTQDIQTFADILSGKKSLPTLSPQTLSLNVETNSLLTLAAINAGKLQEQGYVASSYISDTIAAEPLALAENFYIIDSAKGNLANGIALARASNGKTLISVAAVDNSLESTIALLLKPELRQQLTQANAEQIIAIFNGQSVEVSAPAQASGQVIGTFTVRNENGLHARPSAVLVQTLKPFTAKINVENLDRGTTPANAKSTMKVVALGASKGARLRFVAEGEDAQQAIETLAKAFESGLGESVSYVPETPDSIEGGAAVTAAPVAPQAVENHVQNANSDSLDASFVIKNEHGLHARPSAVLVNEVKKYQAKIEVQNLDKNSPLVSAKSLMKIVALGATKGTTLRFVATGEDAQAALDGIGAAINAGLGE
ncbi:fused PTS fructose transporter subunit IIA/HPr protein [Haemophilus sputorum]|uniref:fused PTS fructose transporter subunit IIA/HPr protein n=1 Tax=Haemophilus sputorum TaxID=1078480 RepID=UPI002104AD87|nr:fused PTS fructose transporter subunit IIA/HPr protein [Haemophilus sputorum]MCQ1857635.1 fused PTS fructose transporter subunit IIA/HPr protein [Haemophilus sputorum]